MNLSLNATYSLEEEDYEEWEKNGIPITAYLIILCMFGTVGNTHVFLVYLLKYKASTYKNFILCLAVVDFLGCTFCIPASLYIIRHRNTVQSLPFCKVYRALMNFTASCSLMILDCIAVERYWKVCQATRVQFTKRTTRILYAVNFIFVFVMIVIPGTIINGINRKTTKAHSLLGYECAVLDQFKSSALAKIHMVSLFIMFVLYLIVSIVLYTLIGRKIFVHQNKHSKTVSLTTKMPESKHTGSESLSTEDSRHPTRHSHEKGMSSDITTSATTVFGNSNSDVPRNMRTSNPRDPDVKSNNSETRLGDQLQQSPETGIKYLHALSERKRKNLDKSRNITMVFLVVSMISFGGYLPYILVSMIWSIDTSVRDNLADNYGALDVFIRWMVFLNNAINPIVYGFLDKKFRNELLDCYVKMTRCCSAFCKRGY